MKVFLFGCICTIPAGILEHFTGAELVQDTLVKSTLASFLLIAPIEEFCKLLAVWTAIYRSPYFREPIDGIIYATTAALAFASVENIVYMGHAGLGIIFSRTIFATPAHVMFSSMWGYSMGMARFQREGEMLTIAKGFGIAIVLHGVYNFLVALHPKTAIITLIPLMIFMGWLMVRRIQDFKKNHPYAPLGDGAVILCPSCGAYTLETEKTCSRCGNTVPPLETDAPRYCGRCRALLDPKRSSCPTCGTAIDLTRLSPRAT
jgi:protease PrsW